MLDFFGTMPFFLRSMCFSEAILAADGFLRGLVVFFFGLFAIS